MNLAAETGFEHVTLWQAPHQPLSRETYLILQRNLLDLAESLHIVLKDGFAEEADECARVVPFPLIIIYNLK